MREENLEPAPRPAFKGYWWIAAIMAVLGLAVLPLDFVLADPNNLEHLPGDLTRVVGLSEIFAHGYGVAIIVAVIWILNRDNRRFVPRIMMCAVWPAAAVHLLKISIGRSRPITYYDEQNQARFPSEVIETWKGFLPKDQLNLIYYFQSFPSAHAATTIGLAIGMSWVFPKAKWLFFGVAILASIQRVTSFAHWPSDVFCGAAIGFVMAGAITTNWGFGYYFGRFENRNQLKLLSHDEDELRQAA